MSELSYVFGSSADRHEFERLAAVQDVFDPGTFRRLGRLGIRPDWVCMEVGPGGGSVMHWLCELVGRVVAIDIDPRFVSTQGRSNLEIHRADVAADAIEQETYDLVHARCVLMHVPQRTQALTNLWRALKPGGWLLIEEPDFSTAQPSESTGNAADALRSVFEATLALYASIGADGLLGRRLPSLLASLGLAGPETETELAVTRGGSSRARIWRMAVEHFAPRLLATGRASAAEMGAFLGAMDDPRTWFMDYALVATWGQRPPA